MPIANEVKVEGKIVDIISYLQELWGGQLPAKFTSKPSFDEMYIKINEIQQYLMEAAEKSPPGSLEPDNGLTRQLQQMQGDLDKLKFVTGDGIDVAYGPNGIHLSVIPPDIVATSGGAEPFFARITEFESIGSNQWEYTIKQVQKTDEKYGGWTVKPSGIQGLAYNTVEDMNDGVGIEGNGVNVDTEEPNDYKNAPIDCVIICWRVSGAGTSASTSNDTTEYWFQYENECTEPGSSSTPI
jgi:hypothetical protein